MVVTFTTEEIEPGRSFLIRRTKTARFGVEICGVPLDAQLSNVGHEDCRFLESNRNSPDH